MSTPIRVAYADVDRGEVEDTYRLSPKGQLYCNGIPSSLLRENLTDDELWEYVHDHLSSLPPAYGITNIRRIA